MKKKDWVSKAILSFMLVTGIALAITGCATAQDEEIEFTGTVNIPKEGGIGINKEEYIEGVKILAYINNVEIGHALVNEGTYTLQFTYKDKYDNQIIKFSINGKEAKQSHTVTPANQSNEVNLEFPTVTIFDINNARTSVEMPSQQVELEEKPTAPGESSGESKLHDLQPLFIVIAIVAGVIIILLLVYFLYVRPNRQLQYDTQRTTAYYPRESVTFGRIGTQKLQVETLQSQLTDTQKELEKYKGALRPYQDQKKRIPELSRGYSDLAIRVKQLGASLNEPLTEKLSDEPTLKEDYGALAERTNLLRTVLADLEGLEQRHQLLVDKCKGIVATIRKSGVDTSVYEKCIAESNVIGLEILRTILELVSKRVEVRKVDPEIIKELETYKERIEQIRDYTYRVPPVALIGFAEEMVQEAVPGEEIALREKTIRIIMNIIDRYLKL